MRDGEPEVRQGLGEGVHGNRAWSREDKRGVGQQRSRTETGQREEGERSIHLFHLWILSRNLTARELSFSRSLAAPCLVHYPVLSSEGSSLEYSPGLHVSLPSSGSPRCSSIHYSTILVPLVLKHDLLPPCTSTYRSQRAFSQGFSSRMAMRTITFLLLE